MQGGFKILSRQAREAKFSRQEVCKASAKRNFISVRRRKNFQLLVFWRRVYAVYVFARGKFSILYISAAPRLRPKPPRI